MRLTTIFNAMEETGRRFGRTTRQYEHFYHVLRKHLAVADGRCATCRIWERFQSDTHWGQCHYQLLPVRPIMVGDEGFMDTHEVHGCRAWQPKEAHGESI